MADGLFPTDWWAYATDYTSTHNATSTPTPTPTSSGSTGSTGSTLTGTQQNAYNALTSLFTSFGLDALAPEILKLVQSGVQDADTVMLLLQDTDAWKTRFAGNELRRAAGLNVLSVPEYLDLETRYDQVLRQYGIPSGMFGRSDFADWIGKNVSAAEIQSRVQLASESVYNSDAYFSQALTQLGIDQGHQIAYFLDENKALPFLQRQFQAAQIGGAALRNNLQFDEQTALTLASLGINAEQAQGGYSKIAQELPTLDKLAQIEGGGFTQSDAEKQVFFGDAAAVRKANKLVQDEAARFSGGSGAGQYANARSLQGAY